MTFFLSHLLALYTVLYGVALVLMTYYVITRRIEAKLRTKFFWGCLFAPFIMIPAVIGDMRASKQLLFLPRLPADPSDEDLMTYLLQFYAVCGVKDVPKNFYDFRDLNMDSLTPRQQRWIRRFDELVRIADEREEEIYQ